VSPLDLNELIGEVLGLYEGSSATIDTELAADLPKVLGDATQIRQLIHNLLRNAEDALEGHEAGRIGIATKALNRTAELLITDNGSGFPPEILPKIFEPYVTTKVRGTGLGMPIVKKIVDEHLGTIEISNAPEGGARICIRLPLVKEEEAKNGNHSGR
jgi:nitrogen fixation/metabolism regulation signal transduction histidine kinase